MTEDALATLKADFDFLDDWEDRYRHVIALGKSLPSLDEAARTPVNKVPGCASQVWLDAGLDGEGRLALNADSDSQLVKGLAAILISLYAGRRPGDIANFDAEGAFQTLGLIEHLTSQRANGLKSMIARIRAVASAYASP